MALRKKMRAKLFATTADTPAALMAMGACSRELPQPKFSPAAMKSPGCTRAMKSSPASSMQWLASSAGSVVLR